MPRENNAMSSAEIEAFMNSVQWVALGVLNENGAPFPALVPAIVSDGHLFFAVPSGSAAHTALERDPRCCCSADIFPAYYEIKGATVHGRARPVQATERIVAALQERARMHGIAGDKVYLLPLLEDAFGFDFAKLERR